MPTPNWLPIRVPQDPNLRITFKIMVQWKLHLFRYAPFSGKSGLKWKWAPQFLNSPMTLGVFHHGDAMDKIHGQDRFQGDVPGHHPCWCPIGCIVPSNWNLQEIGDGFFLDVFGWLHSIHFWWVVGNVFYASTQKGISDSGMIFVFFTGVGLSPMKFRFESVTEYDVEPPPFLKLLMNLLGFYWFLPFF